MAVVLRPAHRDHGGAAGRVLLRNLVVPKGLPLRLALAAAVLDTAANVAMLLALQASMLSLAGC